MEQTCNQNSEVLVLNSDYEPLNVCNMKRAIALVYLGKVDVLHTDHRSIMTLRGTVVTPSVVRLKRHIKRPFPELRLSRKSVFARDNYTCQYCGQTHKELTIDHIIPRHMGGKDTWENLVCCCKKCNNLKGAKTLQQSGFKLLNQPRRPKYVPYISITKFTAGARNETWKVYLPVFDNGLHTIPASAEN